MDLTETGAVPLADSTVMHFGRVLEGVRGSLVRPVSDLMVGDPLDNNVHVFRGSVDGIASAPEDGAINPSVPLFALFGSSLSGAGDMNGDGVADVVVGAPDGSVAPFIEPTGTVYVFVGGSESIVQIESPSAQVGARFGGMVRSAGDLNGDGYDDLAVGAPEFADPVVASGRVYVYYGDVDGVDPLVFSEVANPNSGEGLGFGGSR